MQTSFRSWTTSRRQGHARLPGALERLLRRRGWPERAATAEQVHGSKIAVAPRLGKSKIYRNADGLLTDVPHQPLAIFTADCVPVFVADPRRGVVGILHAGWRGVSRKILPKAVRLMRRRWRSAPRDIRVWTGPAIQRCCFEVRWDVARHFPSTRRRAPARSQDSWEVDLAGELERQTRRLGAHWASAKASRRCTMHDKRFYSYRRDGTDQRQVSVIMKKRKHKEE